MSLNKVKYTVSMENSKPKTIITEINKESLMLMMKEIMEKSSIGNDQLHCVVEESNECSESMIENLLIDPIDSKDLKLLEKSELKKEQFQDQNELQIKISSNFMKPNQLNEKIKSFNLSENKSPSILKNTEESSSNSNEATEFDKLIEITSRCIEYYNAFINEKSVEFSIIEKTFTDLNSNLDMAFSEIISEAQKKQKELKEFLLKKYKEIIDYRQYQDNGLKNILENIRSVHLNNLMKKETCYKELKNKETKRKLYLSLNPKLEAESSANEVDTEKNLLGSHSSDQFENLTFEFHDYANTLNQFYLQMEEIEKSNFKEMVEESVSFINNLICEELKVLMTEKIPSKLCEKRMLRENSKDFLMEDNENDTKLNNGENLAFLDFESFTKLFMDNSKYNNGDEEVRYENKKLEEIISLIEQQNKPENHKKITTDNKEKALTDFNSNQLKKEKSQEKKTNSRSKTTYHVNSNLRNENDLNSNHLNKSPNKTAFNKKNLNEEFTQTKKNLVEDSHKENSLELIKKISSQQNNRSAKIKSYMVSFEDTTNKQSIPLKGNSTQNEQVKTLKNSKSPQKVSKTPTKVTKSNEKKGLITSHHMNSSSEVKFKSSQQTSLKSSRNSGYVSEFKITSSRRQSVALK